uniref:Uncharacterized protein n=1 Tax=Anguilla anguilla TaxID=7936 RepID=A0A0E9UXW5_ANGAN
MCILRNAVDCYHCL